MIGAIGGIVTIEIRSIACEDAAMSDISNLLQEYDELASAVTSASHGLYQSALARWVSLIDEIPAFARECSRLESMNNFSSWYLDLQDRRKGGGMGGPSLDLPLNREAATGMQLALFRHISKGEINAAGFAHSYISPSEPDLNANVYALNNQLFLPTSAAFRRILSRLKDDDLKSPPDLPVAVPASDRIVSVDHNLPAYAETVGALSEVSDAVRGENNFDDPEDKERCVAELSVIPTLIGVNKVRLAVLAAVGGVLIYIVHKFADAMLSKLAANAIKKLIVLFPDLAPFLT
jgi:hypothetical protein